MENSLNSLLHRPFSVELHILVSIYSVSRYQVYSIKCVNSTYFLPLIVPIFTQMQSLTFLPQTLQITRFFYLLKDKIFGKLWFPRTFYNVGAFKGCSQKSKFASLQQRKKGTHVEFQLIDYLCRLLLSLILQILHCLIF